MPPTTRRSISLIGFMGAGKSTVGPRLAAALGLPFVDLDRHIEALHGPIPALLERGEAVFRDLEYRSLTTLDAPCVIATGGGTPVHAPSRLWLERHTTTVFLDATLRSCTRRVGEANDRPLWSPALHTARQPYYASARHRVPADASPDAVVTAVLRALIHREERLADGCPLHIEDGFDGLGDALATHGFERLLLVTDSTVGPSWSPALTSALGPLPTATLPAGERHKTLAHWRDLVDTLLAHRPRRGSGVLILGGGVPGDVGGFAASVIHRGLPTVLLPTTTLAMIDSSVGGKTAINHPSGKNLIGSFHPPRRVWIALQTLQTLPDRHRRAGLAEAVKIALTHDPVLFELLSAMDAGDFSDPQVLATVIRQAVRAKARVVKEDPHDRGPRMALNAGHTVAHALERALGYGTLLHGEAVAIGLVEETRWAVRRGLAPPDITERTASILRTIGLPTALPQHLDAERFIDAVQVDKKGFRDMLDLPCVERVGCTTLLRVSALGFARSILRTDPPSP